MYDGFEHLGHSVAGLGADGQGLRAVQPDVLLDFGLHARHVRARQVDLVEDRDDLVVVVEGEVHVGEGLRLDALRGVHDQQRAFAGRQRTGNLIVEVHMAGGVDEVEQVGVAVLGLVGDADGLRLDGDAALALDVHAVEVLVALFAVRHQPGDFEDAVGKRRFPVVDVGDDAEIADMFLYGH